MYSVSAAKVWVFALRIDDDDDGCGEVVRLMRCAVIECSRPVWSISVSFGMLLLGEENGVRVFGLRRLVKGKVKKVRNLNSKVPNGGVVRDYGKNGKHGVAVKQANVKQNGGACFMALKGKGVETKSISKIPISVKVISIQALSQRMFLMLDSDGDLHILSLSNSGIGVDITGHVRQLPHIMNVQNLAVLPDVSTMSQIVWISDGCHSVYLFNAMDVENALNEADGNDDDKKLMHLPVNHVLFSGEKIQDIICLASNSILILGQDEIDPSTYSFTTALKALQARSGYRNFECLSPEGYALNSKWNEAEKYICNPVSGEVPMECLSAKTLSGRSFRSSTSNRITMSAPLVYSSTQIQTKPSNYSYTQQDVALQFHIPEKKYEGMRKDAATQSTPPYLSSSTTSSILTPSIIDRSMKLSQDSTFSHSKTKSEEQEEVKDKETWETTKETTSKTENNEWRKKDNEQLCRKSGCFSWIKKKKQRENERQRRTNIFLIHFKIC
ncbi:hypothetical protein TanjilG_32433 [Lupinus angustifolius]|uniref:Uncharacterized protein n=1 Tax=Lupinus angustifolius TaxID=3871 RepID=A0A1J7IDT2_LUPAN|nr:hypothetical protein TanjilG_32433 [Lupinus angustifolius]